MSDRRYPGTYATMAILIASTTWAQDKKEELEETYEAFAVALGTSNPPVIPAGMSTTLQINITRWTADEKREALFAVLIEAGRARERSRSRK